MLLSVYLACIYVKAEYIFKYTKIHTKYRSTRRIQDSSTRALWSQSNARKYEQNTNQIQQNTQQDVVFVAAALVLCGCTRIHLKYSSNRQKR